MPSSIEIVVPVLNEEQCLRGSIEQLVAFLETRMAGYGWQVHIVDNGSTDGTRATCLDLMEDHPAKVTMTRMQKPGRGRAVKRACDRTNADVVVMVDADLMDSLERLPAMVDGVVNNGGMASGSKLHPESGVGGRPWKRKMMTRGNNLTRRLLFPEVPITDGQCGLKAFSREVAKEVMPDVRDNGWFLHTELSVLACRRGYRIDEYSIDLVDDVRPSRVKPVRDSLKMIMAYLGLRVRLWRELCQLTNRHPQ